MLDQAFAEGDLDEVNRLEARLWLDGPGSAEGRVGGHARELALAMNAVVLAAGQAEDAGASGVEAWRRLADVRAPTTVAWGERDVPFAIERCQVATAAVPSAWGVVLEGTAHLPYLERPAARRRDDHRGDARHGLARAARSAAGEEPGVEVAEWAVDAP